LFIGMILPIRSICLNLVWPCPAQKMKEIPDAREANPNKATVAIALVLAFVTLGLYAPVLGHAFVDFDDDLYVTANSMVQQGWTWHGWAWAWTTGHSANWHPLTWLSHMTDCSLFGLEPAGHHATSALLHAANTVLLFLLLRRMTGAAWRAAMVAALFGWHPLHVESVAWVAERKDVLSTFFFFLTIWMYLRYVEEFKVQSSKFKVFYGLSLFLFASGLMSKPMLVTLPFVLLLLDYWPLERFGPGVRTRLVVEKLPFLALSAVSCVVTYVVQKSGGAVSDATPFLLRAPNAVLSYGRYLGRMLWPTDLAVLYPYSADVPVVELCACGLLLAALTWLALRRRQQRYLATGWFWYLGTLVPVIGLVQMGPQSSADRYTYIPLIGIFVMIVWGVADLAREWRVPGWAPALAATLALLACAAGTELQLRYWSDSGTLFVRALAVTTGDDLAWNKEGAYLTAEGKTGEALQGSTNSPAVAKNNYLAWNNLGSHLLRQGKPGEALRCFTISLQDRERPVNLHNAGRALEALHRRTEAAAFFAKALALDPHYIPARMSLADSLADEGKNDEAVREYRKVLQLDPGHVDAHCNLACALAAQGKAAEAMTELQQALRLSPLDASTLCNLGNLMLEEGKLDEAAAEYRAALRSKPSSPEIHSNLGAVLALQGRRQEAMDEFNEALRLAPNFTQAKERLKALIGPAHPF
jgi:protein O-mannosyl-transferase